LVLLLVEGRCITRWYTDPVPTKHPRIQVTADPELAAALRRAKRREPGVAASRLLRDLALRGDVAAEEEDASHEAERRAAMEHLIELTTTPGLLDREALAEAHASWTHNVDP
jgi:CMP-N-acetylneuraminic acid synthetase